MKDRDATESKRFRAMTNIVDEHSGGSKKSVMSSSSTKVSWRILQINSSFIHSEEWIRFVIFDKDEKWEEKGY